MSVASLNQARPKQPLTGHVDVLIVGAGISGIGLGHYLTTMLPGHTFAMVDSREAIGGSASTSSQSAPLAEITLLASTTRVMPSCASSSVS